MGGKKRFWSCFALRSLLLAGLLCGLILTAKGGSVAGKTGVLLIGGAVTAVFYAVLWLFSVMRFSVKIAMTFAKKGGFFAKIDHLGSVTALTVALVAAVNLLQISKGIFASSPAGGALLAVVCPVLVLLDWAVFAPHEKKSFSPALLALSYPAFLLCVSGRLFGGGVAETFGWAVVSVLIYVALTAAFYFIGTKLTFGECKKIPYPLLWHDMPVDISSAFGKPEEAGCHGFLKTDGENFVFEDGTPIKFWGVNFNSAQNFPSHEHSEKVASRLRQAGVNMVRFHQLDAEWAAPNIFSFRKGKRIDDTRSFDEESMDRLDYLVYCLKRNGIYVYLDFLTYRRFRVGDGVENAELLPEAAKPYCVFDEKLIALQKEYNRSLLCHVNQYTGLAYKDEPAIALAEVVNECDLLDAEYTKITVEPYRSRLLERYRAYAAERGVQNPNEDVDKRTDPFMRKFLLETQIAYVREIIDDVRAVGGKFPMTAMNRESDRTVILTNGETDFSDSHAYWRGGDQRGFMNDPMSLQRTNVITRQLFTNAIENKPFFVSEWDAPWPNEFRADVTLWTAAVGALQNWSGFTLHTYRYGTTERESITEKLGRSIALGGSYSRGLFDCYNDPAKMGLFYHAALILRRGDVSPAKTTTVCRFSEAEYLSCKDERHLKKVFPERSEEVNKIRFGVGESDVKTFKEVSENVVSDTQELIRDVKKGFGKIDSKRTQVVYGFCQGEADCADVKVKVKNDFATVAVSSLTDKAIAESDSLLLTTVGRADNDGVRYDLFHSVLKKEGRAPVMADVIEADIALRTPYKNLKVWAVNNEGSLIGQLDTTHDGEFLRFTVGKKFESVFYLIQRQ